jgi:hypothetical protein
MGEIERREYTIEAPTSRSGNFENFILVCSVTASGQSRLALKRMVNSFKTAGDTCNFLLEQVPYGHALEEAVGGFQAAPALDSDPVVAGRVPCDGSCG